MGGGRIASAEGYTHGAPHYYQCIPTGFINREETANTTTKQTFESLHIKVIPNTNERVVTNTHIDPSNNCSLLIHASMPELHRSTTKLHQM